MSFISRAIQNLRGDQIRKKTVDSQTVSFRLSNNLTKALGFDVYFYLVGDILIDTGFSHVQKTVVSALQKEEINLICCTHNHEDHTGNCAILAKQHNCEVYLKNSEDLLCDGVGSLYPYRKLFWGHLEPYLAKEVPEEVSTNAKMLKVIDSPGHSKTHVVYFDQDTGNVFTGDLVVSPGVSGVMTQERPLELIQSLRRVAALNPERMLSGHGMDVRAPVALLNRKADRIEKAIDDVKKLAKQGLQKSQIKKRVFKHGHGRDAFVATITQGQYSRDNFIKACLQDF
jgi:glyoxylase-like metal-dependent hydrolase (beta-lactamase superfamily II)